jgi:L(+)-tartrate dehydratase alpha subunit
MNGEPQRMTELVSNFLGTVAVRMPDDVLQKLQSLRSKESGQLAGTIYDAMFVNMERAVSLNRPTCQDTGVIEFFVRAGAAFPYLSEVRAVFTEAVRIATEKTPLRHNAVEPFLEKNTGNNTGTRVPWIDWEIVPGSDLEFDVYMAGGGCSLPGTARVLMPSAGYEGIVQYVFDTAVTYGINACPPLLVGIGIGGSVEVAAVLSKRALMRPLGTGNKNPQAAEMEKRLEDGLNALGLGPQGLGGNASVMGVHIEYAARHPSTIGVGINFGCWAHRRGTMRIHPDMTVEVLSHKGVSL